MEGLSIVICCHNGASRLPTTLAHLKEQEPPGAPWEVLLVDNGSTDDTAAIARSCWQDGPAPLRIVYESRLGTGYARERGFREARYSFIGFVDDDNWVARHWVRLAHEIMSSDPRLGAVGSLRMPACEVPSPSWFDQHHETYAILTEQDLERMQDPPVYLPTAGLCVRKEAWQELVHGGVRWLLSGSVGQVQLGGEDVELTIMLRSYGWKLHIDPRLRMQHFMPKQRLQWTYFRRLMRNYSSTVVLDAYSEHSLSLKAGLRQRISDWWWYQLGRTLVKLARQPGAVLAALTSAAEGRYDVSQVEHLVGRALGFLRSRGRYGASRRMVREASWRRLSHPDSQPKRVPDSAASTV